MSTNPRVRHRLRLERLRSRARLGHLPDERAEPQDVLLSVSVDFDAPPAACGTDRLEDTVCGAELCEALVRVCESGEYALIEHLAARLYATARALVRASAHVEIEVVKVAPPIVGLEGGMSFVITGSGRAMAPDFQMRALSGTLLVHE
jgi:FolB domain-containing protein